MTSEGDSVNAFAKEGKLISFAKIRSCTSRLALVCLEVWQLEHRPIHVDYACLVEIAEEGIASSLITLSP
jgi:hypothetical protein